MKTFEFVEADRKTVLVVEVAEANPITSTLVDLEHLNLTLHAQNARLAKRVTKLKAERDAWKSAAQEAGLRTYDGLAQENAHLRKVLQEMADIPVVDFASQRQKLAEVRALLSELDGDKYKCRHLVSDQVGVTSVCRSCGEMC